MKHFNSHKYIRSILGTSLAIVLAFSGSIPSSAMAAENTDYELITEEENTADEELITGDEETTDAAQTGESEELIMDSEESIAPDEQSASSDASSESAEDDYTNNTENEEEAEMDGITISADGKTAVNSAVSVSSSVLYRIRKAIADDERFAFAHVSHAFDISLENGKSTLFTRAGDLFFKGMDIRDAEDAGSTLYIVKADEKNGEITLKDVTGTTEDGAVSAEADGSGIYVLLEDGSTELSELEYMQEEETLKKKASGFTVSVTGTRYVLNGADSLLVKELRSGVQSYVEDAVRKLDGYETASVLTILDISLTDADGNSIEPDGEVSVCFKGNEIEKAAENKDASLSIVHLTEDPARNVSTDSMDVLDTKIDRNGAANVTTDSFSPYAIVLNEEHESTQKETSFRDDGTSGIELNKYVSGKNYIGSGETTEITLETACYDTNTPHTLSTLTPDEQDLYYIVDESSSIIGSVGRMNAASRTFMKKVAELNRARIIKAAKGGYSNFDSKRISLSSTVYNSANDAEWEAAARAFGTEHLVHLKYIVGFNMQTQDKFTGDSIPITDSEADTLAGYASFTTDNTADGTRTDLATQAAYNKITNMSRAYVYLLTDGEPWGDTDNSGKFTGGHTDGIMMTPANANRALSLARAMKDGGATLSCIYVNYRNPERLDAAYTQGDLSLIPKTAENYGAYFLEMYSSDFMKNGTWSYSSGSDGNDFHYTCNFGSDIYTPTRDDRIGMYTHYVSDTSDLASALGDAVLKMQYDTLIGSGSDRLYAGASSSVTDIVTDPFTINGGTSGIRVYRAARRPAGVKEGNTVTLNSGIYNGTFEWEPRSEWEDITNQVYVKTFGETGSSISNRFEVTGYDYEENAATSYDKDYAKSKVPSNADVYHRGDYGYKICITVSIRAKETFGGNNIATNVSGKSAFYPSVPTKGSGMPDWRDSSRNTEKTDYLASYPVPVIDLKPSYDIPYNSYTIYAPETKETLALVKQKSDNSVFVNDSSSGTLVKYVPNGHNNQFVDIEYTLKTADGRTAASMSIPHGAAYTTDDNPWIVKPGFENLGVSGEYTLTCTVTPVATTASPTGAIASSLESDEAKKKAGYTSTEYSTTGSSKDGQAQTLTIRKNPYAHIFTLQITAADTVKHPQQSLDFNPGTKELTADGIHITDVKWVRTDSTKDNLITPGAEDGKVPAVQQNTVVSPEAQSGLVSSVNGQTIITAEDGQSIPAAVLLSRTIRKSGSPDTKAVYLSDSDALYAGKSSVAWIHECAHIDDCTNTVFKENKDACGGKDDGSSDYGPVRFLIHVSDLNPPKIIKETSTQKIYRGDDIHWTISVSNTDEKENKRHQTLDNSVYDILPYNGDERVSPADGKTGSHYGGKLILKSLSIDLSSAPGVLAKLKGGAEECRLYYTTDENIRSIADDALAQDASWKECPLTVSGNAAQASVPAGAAVTAVRFRQALAYGESFTISMTAAVDDIQKQFVDDRYLNNAFSITSDRKRTSSTVETDVYGKSIGGVIWEDSDADSLMAEDEPKLKGITVTLYRAYGSANGDEKRTVGSYELTRAARFDGTIVSVTSTDENGKYEFDDLSDGNYYVVADRISAEYILAKKQAGKGKSDDFDSEAEESFQSNADTTLDKSAIITNIGISSQAPNAEHENIGLQRIEGSVTVHKALSDMRVPGTLDGEFRDNYRASYLLKLTNTVTGKTWTKSISFTKAEFDAAKKEGKEYIASVKFDKLPILSPAGTVYTLEEITQGNSEFSSIRGINGNIEGTQNGARLTLTYSEANAELIVNNQPDKLPQTTNISSVNNQISVPMPVSISVSYSGENPIGASNHSLVSHTFTAGDFSDIVLKYENGVEAKLSDGTLDFNRLTFSPKTVTNLMNTNGKETQIGVSYTENGRVISTYFSVAIDLKPLHFFTIRYHANKGSFDSGNENLVHYVYDEVNNQLKVTGDDAYKTPASPNASNGIYFRAWNTRADGNGTVYAPPGQEVSGMTNITALAKDQTIANNSVIDLYAGWYVKVSFDATDNGYYPGARIVQTETTNTSGWMAYEHKYSARDFGYSCRLDGYSFLDEWNDQPNMQGNALGNDKYVTADRSVTYYAEYIKTSYGYTGGVQIFKAPKTGYYTIELYGARSGAQRGGQAATYGDYVKGTVKIQGGTTLYIYVGGSGESYYTGTYHFHLQHADGEWWTTGDANVDSHIGQKNLNAHNGYNGGVSKKLCTDEPINTRLGDMGDSNWFDLNGAMWFGVGGGATDIRMASDGNCNDYRETIIMAAQGGYCTQGTFVSGALGYGSRGGYTFTNASRSSQGSRTSDGYAKITYAGD